MIKKPMKETAERLSDLEEFAIERGQEFESGTDRGFVLVVSNQLDVFLGRLLATFMIDDETLLRDLVDSGNAQAPLGNFSARIKAAVCLGLISKREAECLNIVRTIRNDYAHILTSEIRARAADSGKSNLVRLRKLHQSLQVSFDEAAPFKVQMLTVSHLLLGSLNGRIIDAEDFKRVPPPDARDMREAHGLWTAKGPELSR